MRAESTIDAEGIPEAKEKAQEETKEVMRWLVVEAALGLLRTLRRSVDLVLLASELMVLRLRYPEQEDSHMAIVLPFKLPKQGWPELLPLAAHPQVERGNLTLPLVGKGSLTHSDLPDDHYKA